MSDLKTRTYLLAEKLNIAEQTVKNHVHRMQRKVGTSQRLMIANACITSFSTAQPGHASRN